MTAENSVPDATDKTWLVRMCLGDSSGTKASKTPISALFSNADIEQYLTIQPIPTYCAAALCEVAAAAWAAQVTQTLGKTRQELSDKIKHAKLMAKNLRDGGPGDIPGGDGSGAPDLFMEVGGISRDEKAAFRNDPDRIQPNFSLGMDDAPNPPSFGDRRDDSGRQRFDDCD